MGRRECFLADNCRIPQAGARHSRRVGAAVVSPGSAESALVTAGEYAAPDRRALAVSFQHYR